MGATRKLQGEIDRVLKKVQEGVDVFDSIWNKVYDTENANQKEKFEADLKKEIKKLQRYRDQIKTWIQSSEIKDKKALLDARKLIEREMERFKVCEKETKTKAFSKEGLGQQPKTDPKEKAKSESREWLNNMVTELESQIDTFEAEMEGLFVKKGKNRPPRLTHLEDSISRHKTHISKLELILRLLDNDELSPEQINDVKDFVEDYVDRNQDDFEEFADVDELYNSLPLDKLEALETLDAVSSVSPAIAVKDKPIAPAVPAGATQISVPNLLGGESSSEELLLVSGPQTSTLPLSISLISSLNADTLEGSNVISAGVVVPVTGVNSVLSQKSVVSPTGLLSGSTSIRGVSKATGVLLESPSTSLATRTKEEDGTNLASRRIASGITGIGRPTVSVGLQSAGQTTPLVPLAVSASSFSASGLGGSGGLNSTNNVSDLNKRSGLVADERILGGGSFGQQLSTPISVQNRVFLQSGGKILEPGATGDSATLSEGGLIGSRLFNPSVVSGGQWRPPSASAFQSPAEPGQILTRTEIAPDQKQKFLQRFQQVHQGGHSAAMLSAAAAAQLSHLSSPSQKQQQVISSGPQIALSQQNTTQTQLQLLQHQQPNPSLLQASQTLPLQQQQQAGLTIGLQAQFPTSSPQQSNQPSQLPISATSQQLQQLLLSSALSGKEKDATTNRAIDLQQQSQAPQQLQLQLPKLAEDGNTDTGALSASFARAVSLSEDDLKNADTFDVSQVGGPGTLAELSQQSRDADFTPGQQMQSSQSPGPGVIGRRSAADLGAIGDNLTTSIGGGTAAHDQLYNLQMLEAAYRHIPTPRDSERPRSYVPRNPAVVPSSYPQIPAAIIENPALWERLDPDVLFFAFYYQQNTYQQYLAARELKKQSWRYHKKYNTWFQRHEEPKVTTDEYEQGTYVYFDYNMIDDKHGWCQRIKAEFTFEYSYLEDELVV
ncbi:hypothetical protein O6H91_02G074100 [Diphasiastrum complanatum]|uniref:Uncharacterized protein n=2 Tax=Diphasiastrum complanatum TaxID=34168 RepID=A0ACC2EGT0_DIPCM|nr:hypothetical protein O6H91_02G074100 [Diphasiastrum complanatum]KAJ7565769.1 hypothetical protein O6H91_02G074100 [Diphasiastrum complanatum]